MTATEIDEHGLCLKEMVQELPIGALHGLSCQLLIAYFSISGQKFVVES